MFSMPRTLRQVLTVVLLIAGVAAYVAAWGKRHDPLPQLLVIVAIAGVAAIPAVARRLDRGLSKLRHPSPRAAAVAAWCVGAAGAIYLFAAASIQGRNLDPKWHDEQM